MYSVLFCDIVGSSKLYQQLGNQRAEEKIRLVLQTLSACAEKYSGRVVKTIGDEIMCSFDTFNHAAESAIEMNRLGQATESKLRTGISTGHIVERDGDLFGEAVNNAAFLTKYARADEVLLDEMTLENSVKPTHYKIDLIAQLTMKGNASPKNIYRLNWELISDSARCSPTQFNPLYESANENIGKKLVLTHLGKEFTVSRERPFFIVGRDKEHASLIINHVKISRRHVSITYDQGKFILEDHSTNGTYLADPNNNITQVHREAFALIGEGELRLGQKTQANDCTIFYKTL